LFLPFFFSFYSGVGAQLFGVARSEEIVSPGEFNIAPHEALLVFQDILARQRIERNARKDLKPLSQSRKMMGVPLPHKPQGLDTMTGQGLEYNDSAG